MQICIKNHRIGKRSRRGEEKRISGMLGAERRQEGGWKWRGINIPSSRSVDRSINYTEIRFIKPGLTRGASEPIFWWYEANIYSTFLDEMFPRFRSTAPWYQIDNSNSSRRVILLSGRRFRLLLCIVSLDVLFTILFYVRRSGLPFKTNIETKDARHKKKAKKHTIKT